MTARARQEIKSGNVERVRRSTNEFHRVLIELAQSPTLTEIAGKLVARSLFFLPFEWSYFELMQSEQVAIADAVQGRQLDEAARLLADHHSRHAMRLRQLLQEREAEPKKARLTA